MGAPFAFNGQGAADVNDDAGAGPVLVASLALNDGGNTETLGDAVALDGARALLGAPLDDVAPNRAQGSVRSYDGSAAWTQLAPLQDGDGAQNEVFGFSLALDGLAWPWASTSTTRTSTSTTLAPPRCSCNPGGWQREARLVPAGVESEDRSGISVALRAEVLAVGAYFDIVGIEFNQGGGDLLARHRRLAANRATDRAQRQRNDLRLLLAYDGDTLLVGVRRRSAAFDAGAATCSG